MSTRTYPRGPRIHLPLAMIAQALPWLFPFDPLAFAIENTEFGDIAHYRIGRLHVYQLNTPELIRQVLVEQPENSARASRTIFAPVLAARAQGRFAPKPSSRYCEIHRESKRQSEDNPS